MSIPTMNEHTGQYMLSKASTDTYRDNWEAIFGKGKKKEEETAEKTVVIPFKVLLEWRQEWMDANDPEDGTDCVSPFDKYIYGEWDERH
jgi:hypothetical protein